MAANDTRIVRTTENIHLTKELVSECLVGVAAMNYFGGVEGGSYFVTNLVDGTVSMAKNLEYFKIRVRDGRGREVGVGVGGFGDDRR